MYRGSFLTSLALVVAAQGCASEDETPDTSSGETKAINLQFQALVGDEPFECDGTYEGIGADGFDLTLSDARMFVHDVELLRKDGSAVPVVMDADGEWQRENLALIDFEDGSVGCRFGTEGTHTAVTGKAPEGEYDGVRFKVGVPFDDNHQDEATAKPPLNQTSMFWSWNGGYKFLRVDGTAEEAGTVAMHLGSTGCKDEEEGTGVESCKYGNRATIELTGFDPAKEAIALDIERLFADTRSGTSFCISDPGEPACEGPFSHLGMSKPSKQDAFRVVGRVQEPQPEAGMPEGGMPDGGGEDCQDLVPEEDYVWDLPEGFPQPDVPEGNPMSDAKVELGRRLFYDTQLSFNETQSCASCHDQSLSFTDGLAGSVGSTGEVHRRSSMSLANLAYYGRFTWANPLLKTLEEQAEGPLFGDTPVELGWAGKRDELIARLEADPDYPQLFEEAFGTDCTPVSLDHLTKAIASFERTLISGDSPYDRYWYGEEQDALSADARAGLALFNSEKFECFHCHGGQAFSSNTPEQPLFNNNGLYDVDGEGAYPEVDQGAIEVTMVDQHMGRFKPPSLRNIALTAPYMHDGSLATLDDVLDHYASGGTGSPLTDSFILGFQMNDSERRQLKAFLESLTDETFVNDPRFASPF